MGSRASLLAESNPETPASGSSDLAVSEAAAELHRDAFVMDLHADTLLPMRMFEYRLEKRHRFRLPASALFWHCDLPRFREGGVNAQFFGVVTAPRPERGCGRTVLAEAARLARAAERNADQMAIARSAADVRRIYESGRLAALLGVEGAHNIEGDPAWVTRFAEAGVRYMGLAHFTTNTAAPAAHGLGASNDAVLSDIGRQTVAEMNRVGMVVDLAHVGRRAFLEAAGLASAPVYVSHTGIAAAYDMWRNIDDEQLRAVAETDGVVGIIFAGRYLAPRGRRDVKALLPAFEHVRKTIGARHLALGSDFDGFIVPVRGLENVAKLPVVTELLLEAGWSEGEIRGVLGENALRVLAANGG